MQIGWEEMTCLSPLSFSLVCTLDTLARLPLRGKEGGQRGAVTAQKTEEVPSRPRREEAKWTCHLLNDKTLVLVFLKERFHSSDKAQESEQECIGHSKTYSDWRFIQAVKQGRA